MRETALYAEAIDRHRSTISAYRQTYSDSKVCLSLKENVQFFDVSPSGKAARSTFALCGAFIASLPEKVLPAELEKAIRDHRGNHAAAWSNAIVWLASAAGSAVVADTLDGDCYIVPGAFWQSDAAMEMLRILICDVAAEPATPATNTASTAVAQSCGPKLADELRGEPLKALLMKARAAEMQLASDTAFQSGRGESAEADAEEAAQELYRLTDGEMVTWLIDHRYVAESAAGDENFKKRVGYMMWRTLKWPRLPRANRRPDDRGATGELAGKGIIGRETRINHAIDETKWCWNHKITKAAAGERFCETCMKRFSRDELEKMLDGDTPCDGDRLKPEEIELRRQQVLDVEPAEPRRRRYAAAGR